MARPRVMVPSWVGLALKEAPTQAYTAGRICSSHLQGGSGQAGRQAGGRRLR
jgi:hypothetical protein